MLLHSLGVLQIPKCDTTPIGMQIIILQLSIGNADKLSPTMHCHIQVTGYIYKVLECSSTVLALATSTYNLTVTINCGIQTTSIGVIFEEVL